MTEFEDIRPFLERHHRSVVNTLQPDGTLQATVVACGAYQGQVVFVVQGRTVKTRNLRRNPHCTVTTVDEQNWSGYVVVRGKAHVFDATNTEAETLRHLLRAAHCACSNKEHSNWNEYDRVMRQRDAKVVLVRPEHIYWKLRSVPDLQLSVMVHPHRIYLMAFALGVVLQSAMPIVVFPLPQQIAYVVGGLCMAVGASILTWVLYTLRQAGTPFDTQKRTTTLCMSGPFRLTRHPTYLAYSLLYTGVSIALQNIWGLALLIPALYVMHRGVVLREENHLEDTFGEPYRRYQRSVRRWLPMPVIPTIQAGIKRCLSAFGGVFSGNG